MEKLLDTLFRYSAGRSQSEKVKNGYVGPLANSDMNTTPAKVTTVVTAMTPL